MYPLPFGPEPIPFTRDIYVPEATFLPFASLKDGYVPFRRSSEVDGQIGEFSTGTLLRTRPSRGVVWWNVNVWAREVISRDDDPLPQQQDVQGNGIQVSALKVRVKFPEYPSRERDILMDIGAGFTISVGPTTQVEVELVVPDPDKFEGLIPDGLQNLRTSTYVVASAWAVQAPIGRPSGRVTQAVLVRDPAQVTQFVKIGDGARFVQVFSNTGGVSPPAYRVRESIADPPVGLISFPLGDFSTEKVEIAQNAKFISFEALAGRDEVLNVVQELEL